MRLLGTWIMAATLVTSVAVGLTDNEDPVPTTRAREVPAGPTEQERLEQVLANVKATTPTTVPPPPTTTTAPPPPPAPAPPAPPPAPAPAPPAPPPPPAPNAGDEARALQLVNDERAKAGLPALQLSTGARSVGRTWSSHMAGSGLAHNPDLSGDLARAGVTGWRTIGENVGYSSTVDQVHRLFMGSSGHRANILKPEFSHVGIGVVRSGGKAWVTIDFVGY